MKKRPSFYDFLFVVPIFTAYFFFYFGFPCVLGILLLIFVFFVRALMVRFRLICFLTLEAPTSLNGQIHSNKSSTIADELFECV